MSPHASEACTSARLAERVEIAVVAAARRFADSVEGLGDTGLGMSPRGAIVSASSLRGSGVGSGAALVVQPLHFSAFRPGIGRLKSKPGKIWRSSANRLAQNESANGSQARIPFVPRVTGLGMPLADLKF